MIDRSEDSEPFSLGEWLDVQWASIVASDTDEPDAEMDRILDSPVVSIRFAAITQLLGKLEDPSRDLLCMQRQAQSLGGGSVAWDARSLCKSVVVPWAQRHDIGLGSSLDPYVNNPLRRARLDDGSPVRNPQDWQHLVMFLAALQETGEPKDVERSLLRFLRSAARRRAKETVVYPVPNRISVQQLEDLLHDFLDDPSKGLRPLVVATTVLRIVGESLAWFSRVESQALNEADVARGMPADIVCLAPDGKIRTAVEVKAGHMTLTALDGAIQKCRNCGVAHLLIVTPGLAKSDREAIVDRMRKEWAMGLGVVPIEIVSFTSNVFSLLDECWRTGLARGIGEELDARGAGFVHRKRWADLLRLLQ